MDSQNPSSSVLVTNVPINNLGEILGVLDLDVVLNEEVSSISSSWDLLHENPRIENIPSIQVGEVDPSIKKFACSHQESSISKKNLEKAFFEIQANLSGTSQQVLSTTSNVEKTHVFARMKAPSSKKPKPFLFKRKTSRVSSLEAQRVWVRSLRPTENVVSSMSSFGKLLSASLSILVLGRGGGVEEVC